MPFKSRDSDQSHTSHLSTHKITSSGNTLSTSMVETYMENEFSSIDSISITADHGSQTQEQQQQSTREVEDITQSDDIHEPEYVQASLERNSSNAVTSPCQSSTHRSIRHGWVELDVEPTRAEATNSKTRLRFWWVVNWIHSVTPKSVK
ncbi:hypothetical protein EMCG_08965 [[Emmonsia] crescens]|uniref:Uncharacterized protein n=1 Tax=[Emmonsia] crescens TaxID=73230 RepID=A0A0G2I4K9_9EURO|nr:hypothetical protein EMCG_08965 [Emmonsia crescens UAMH 3008]